MTYPGSRSHLWVPGERVDDTVLNEWGPKNVAWGHVAAASGTGSQSGITTVTDVTSSSITVPQKAGRRYKVMGFLTCRWTVVAAPINNSAYLDVLIRNAANTQLASSEAPADGSGTGLLGWRTVWVVAFLAPSVDGTDSYKLSIQRSSLTTSGTLEIGGTWGLWAEDIGLQTP